jgi:hypothetical protein
METESPDRRKGRLESADLLSSTGALVLGIGLGALLAAYIGRAALPVLVVGIISHGWGMLQKHRLESGGGYRPAWWETTLYWGCWAALAALLLLITVNAFTN